MTYLNLNDYDAVLFDLDGTIADSMHIWRDIDIDFLNIFNIEMPQDLQKNIEGMSFYQTAVYFKNTFGISWSLEEMMDCWNRMAYEHYEHSINLKAGVIEFLNKIKKHNIKTSICTSNSRKLTEVFLEARDINKYFDIIVTSKEVTKGKPAPDIYLHAADLLGVDNSRCLVMEDLPAGIIAGRDAGMKTCAVDDSYSSDLREEKKRLADIYLDDYLKIKYVS
ncbi:MAG: HAD family phosphatase [Lachnospiraceae bacterium]|nr:HAD family phosphatase [Lachnospiraceae bacterium]